MAARALKLVSPDNCEETAMCGARLARAEGRCERTPEPGRERCRLHGGTSTGPRTEEGRRRVGDARRQMYIGEAIAEGWLLLPAVVVAAIAGLKQSLRNSHNATAIEIGLSRHGLRRALGGLPVRPGEIHAIDRWAARHDSAHEARLALRDLLRPAAPTLPANSPQEGSCLTTGKLWEPSIGALCVPRSEQKIDPRPIRPRLTGLAAEDM